MWNVRIGPGHRLEEKWKCGLVMNLESDVVLSCNEDHINLYTSEGKSALSRSSTGA